MNTGALAAGADAVIDLRYATPNNFVGAPMYPADARCLVHESMAPGLAAAAAMLRPGGEVLAFWDCYRPHDVQVRMFEAVPDPNWVARPGPYARSHEAGRSVDVTIGNAQGLVDMGTDFDDFIPGAVAFATDGVSAAARRPGAVAGRDEGRRIDGVQGGVVALRHQRCLREAPDSQCAGELGDSITRCRD